MTAATTAQYQGYDNTTWDWGQDPGTGPNAECTALMSAWITAINANASQSGKQVSLLRDYSDSTSANYGGFVIATPMMLTADTVYHQLYTWTATNSYYYVGTGFTDNTSNGGYGGVTSIIDSHTNVSGFKSAVTSTCAIITATSTVDGEEFFLYAWNQENSTSYNGFFLLTKDNNGEWASMCQLGSIIRGCARDTIQNVYSGIDALTSTGYSIALGRMAYYTSDNPGAVTELYEATWLAASPALYSNSSSISQGTYTNVDGSTDQIIKTCYYGPYLRYATV